MPSPPPDRCSSRLVLLDDFVHAARDAGRAEPALCSAAANHLREIKAADAGAPDRDVWDELHDRLTAEYDTGWMPDHPADERTRCERHFDRPRRSRRSR